MIAEGQTERLLLPLIQGGSIMNNCFCNLFDNNTLWLIIIAIILLSCCCGH